MIRMDTNDAGIRERHARVGRSRTFENALLALGLGESRVLDVGCGYGEHLAAFGKGSVGITTNLEEVAYGKRIGLDIRAGNAEALDEENLIPPYDAIWANNLFEHLLSPHAFLMGLRPFVKDDGYLVLGVPIVVPIIGRLSRFRGALASNHIGFYTPKTLRLTVERAGWQVETLRPFLSRFALVDRCLAPFAPHLYVIAKSSTAFSYPEKKIKEWQDDPRYARLLASAPPRG